MVANDNPPTPSDINWSNYDLSSCGKFIRIMVSFLIIILFLALSSTIVGLCGVYISSHSNNCDSVDISGFTATTISSQDENTIRCYCNANIVASFTDE